MAVISFLVPSVATATTTATANVIVSIGIHGERLCVEEYDVVDTRNKCEARYYYYC